MSRNFSAPEVEAEAGLGEDDLGPPQREARRHQAVAAVSDVAEGAAMDEGRRAFGRLHEVRKQRVAEQRGHRALGLEVAGEDRLGGAREAEQDPTEPRLQVRVVARQAEDRHHLAGGGDVEAALARHTHCLATQAEDGVAQEAVVHVQDAAERHLPVVELQTAGADRRAEVDVIVRERGEQVVGRGDGVQVAREVQVDAGRGLELGLPAAGAAALLAEDRPERGLAQRARGAHAEAACGLCQADRAGGLAFARGRRADGGDQHQAGLERILAERDLGADLGDAAAPALDVRRAEGPDPKRLARFRAP